MGSPKLRKGKFAKKAIGKRAASRIDPSRLSRVPREGLNQPGAPNAAYVDRKNGVVVQVWTDQTPGCNGTPWEGTLRVAVKHSSAVSREQMGVRHQYAKPITWDDLQAIKDHFWPDRIGMELFPPRANIVDVADMRWLWVLPKGAVLPFNLEGHSIDKLES